jgi:hypothetical protein
MKAWIAAAALMTVGIVAAAPAAADESEFFNLLNSQYLRQHYTNTQLLGEAYKVCNDIHTGNKDVDAVDLVQRDLSVSSSAAIDRVTSATNGLGC